ncbi:MAG: IS4 family transposase [Candidatus Aminicenantes bacterium]|nr:IS4 family transposase [Candidatus Aminicenantes bacterium]
MIRQASVFCQLLQVFPRIHFAQLVKKHRTEHCSKGFSSWTQFVAMLFCHLAQAKSLREICDGLRSCEGRLVHLGIAKSPSRSTLSYANKHRSWELYQDLFYETLVHCQLIAPVKKFRFKNKLLSIDATVIDLCLSMFPWAQFRTTKGAIKLHLLLDHDGYLPTYVWIREAAVHEINFAHSLDLPAELIVVIDMGFTDYKLYGRWTKKGIWFVTRQKENAAYDRIKTRRVPKNRNILSDEIIEFRGFYARQDCPDRMRRIVVLDKDKGEEIVLLTNILHFGATTIAAIYKDRWQIEIFFKALKQNLKVKTFVGTSENALKIQIWTALIAMLLLKYLQFKSRHKWSLSNLVFLLQRNLFT